MRGFDCVQFHLPAALLLPFLARSAWILGDEQRQLIFLHLLLREG
jgi:hypothetical protein